MAIPPEVLQLIDQLAADLKPIVASIEAGVPVTQNHYGRYMNILARLDGNEKQLLCIALVKAGANKAGVHAAYKLIA